MGWGSALGGLLMGGASAFGSHQQSQAQAGANEMNLIIAREQMDFQRQMANSAQAFSERMAGSAHQREVADLRAAGLNPILSAGGSGAPSPAGVSASGASARMEAVPSVVALTMNSALAGLQTIVGLKQASRQLDLQALDVKQKGMYNKLYEKRSDLEIELLTSFRKGMRVLTGAVSGGMEWLGDKIGNFGARSYRGPDYYREPGSNSAFSIK